MTFNNVIMIYPNYFPYLFFLGSICYALAKPNSNLSLLSICISQFFITYQRFPFIANHLLFISLLDLFFLISIIRNYQNRNQILDDAFQITRYGLIALYITSLLHKMNWGFLNTETSCASNFFPFFAFFAQLAPYAALFSEACIAILLAFNRTLFAGVILALVTHFVWGFHKFLGITDFSFTLFALYFLFFSRPLMDKIIALISRLPKSTTVIIAIIVTMTMLFIYVQQAPWQWVVSKHFLFVHKNPFYPFTFYFWLVFAVAIFTALLLGFFKENSCLFFGIKVTKKTKLAPLIFILVVTIGFMPYLGLRSSPSFSMFSNLQTFDGKYNHIFIPKIFKVVDWEEDLVEVVDTTSPILYTVLQLSNYFQTLSNKQPTNQKQYLPYKGLIAWMGTYKGSATYIRNGKIEIIDYKDIKPMDRFFSFRPISLTENPNCMW